MNVPFAPPPSFHRIDAIFSHHTDLFFHHTHIHGGFWHFHNPRGLLVTSDHPHPDNLPLSPIPLFAISLIRSSAHTHIPPPRYFRLPRGFWCPHTSGVRVPSGDRVHFPRFFTPSFYGPLRFLFCVATIHPRFRPLLFCHAYHPSIHSLPPRPLDPTRPARCFPR